MRDNNFCFHKNHAATRYRSGAAAFLAALLLFSATGLPVNAENKSEERATYIAELDGTDENALKTSIAKLCPDVKFLYDYDIALDGFSFTVNENELYKLTSFDGVLFWETNTYNAPEPLDASSSSIIGADTETLKDYRGEGMVIAVIDVGFDTDHEIFTLTEPESVKISSDAVAEAAKKGLTVSNWLAYEKTSPYISEKIPFAYDYYNQSTTFTSVADHGDHVAAIAAGNAENASDANASDGVAPQAQLLLMNVGDENGENINDANIYAAMEDAIKLGADVINISLGRVAGFGNTDISDEGYERVIKRAYELGIDVVCAAGNTSKLGEGSNFDDAYGITEPLASDPDYSVISDPGCFPYSVSAAASVNSNYMLDDYIQPSEGSPMLYYAPSNSDFTAEFGGKTPEYVVIPGLGDVSDYSGIDVNGKIALISRGTITFADKVKNAEAAGAMGALVYDNTDSTELINMAVDDDSIPCAAISKVDGLALAGLQTKTFTVVTDAGKVMPAPHAGELADYSSWGVTSDMRLKPDITAPGSNIYSAVNGGYETMNGTSMASPHIAGALAVIKQYIKTLDTTGLTDAQKLALPRALLMSSALPVEDKAVGADYSPRLQGAGLVNLTAAVSSGAYVYNASTLESKLELGDKIGDTYSLTFTVKNLTDRTLDYYIEATAMTDGYEYIKYGDDGNGDWFITGDPTVLSDASIKLEGGRGAELNAYSDGFKKSEAISIPAASEKTFTVNVKLDASESKALDKIFTSGWYIDGFVKLTARDEGNSSLSIPYMGFKGDWSALDAFDLDGNFYTDILCTGITDGKSMALYQLGQNILGKGEISNSDRCIISTNGDGILDYIGIRLSLLRNCKSGTCYITDSNGKTVYQSEDLGLLQKAYYNTDEDSLAVSYMNLLWDGTSEDNTRFVYPDGNYTLTISVVTDGGDTQTRSFNFTVDTKKPQLDKYYFTTENDRVYLHVDASDNTFLASMSVYEEAALADNADDDALNDVYTYEADMDSKSVDQIVDVTDYIKGNSWLYVELIDYAFNYVTCRVSTDDYGG